MKIFSMTDVGRKREINQDYVFATDEPLGTLPNLLVVADGMGGHKAGDFASKYTVEVLEEEIKHTLKEGPEEILRDAVQTANHKLIEAAGKDIKLEGMGTTLVAATVVGHTLYFANVGDSRLYLINKDIRQLSRDHSLVEEMVRLGGINEEEAKHQDNGHIAEGWSHGLVTHKGIDEHRQTKHVDACRAPNQQGISLLSHQLATNHLQAEKFQRHRNHQDGEKFHHYHDAKHQGGIARHFRGRENLRLVKSHQKQ